MFNLYKNAVDQNSFIGLVNKSEKIISEKEINENRWIVSSFVAISVLVLSVIANGSQSQARFEAQKLASLASYSNIA